MQDLIDAVMRLKIVVERHGLGPLESVQLGCHPAELMMRVRVDDMMEVAGGQVRTRGWSGVKVEPTSEGTTRLTFGGFSSRGPFYKPTDG